MRTERTSGRIYSPPAAPKYSVIYRSSTALSSLSKRACSEAACVHSASSSVPNRFNVPVGSCIMHSSRSFISTFT